MLEHQLFFETNFTDGERAGLLARVKKERAEGVSAYYDLPFERRAIDDAKRYMCENRAILDTLCTIVIIGVGGSSLGLKAIDALLSHLPERKGIKLYFLEHTDPIAIEQSLLGLDPKNSLFIVISKSGTTIETSSLMKYILHRYNLLSKEAKGRLLVITDEGSKLARWAYSQEVEAITISPKVGGRFSVLSAVGIVPLALLGYDVEQILQGARSVGERFFSAQAGHILDKALFLFKNKNSYPINIVFSYSSLFREFNAWYVQLWGESLGKINTHQNKCGLTPIALIGSIDQHSFLQLIVQGSEDKSVTFIGAKKTPEFLPTIPMESLPFLEETDFVNGTSFKKLLRFQREATMETVRAEGVPTDLILLEQLDAQNVGALIYYYELLTSCVGALFEINTYNQPGVEFGKKRLREKFSLD